MLLIKLGQLVIICFVLLGLLGPMCEGKIKNGNILWPSKTAVTARETTSKVFIDPSNYNFIQTKCIYVETDYLNNMHFNLE